MVTLLDAAIDVIKILQNASCEAYFVGGFVRDKLLGISSSDIDIVTSMKSEEIMKLFPKTIPVGINFGIVMVIHMDHPFEVATFRQDESYIDGRHPSGIKPATLEEDARRRDFTINGLYYDPIKDKIIDTVGGIEDLNNKILRAIGDPKERFKEDRLRMIRAARYSAHLNLKIDKMTKEAIILFAPFVKEGVSSERIFQELSKMHQKNCLAKGLEELFDLKLLKVIFPLLELEQDSIILDRICMLKKITKKAPLLFYLIVLLEIETKEALNALIDYLKSPKQDLAISLMLIELLKASHDRLFMAELFSKNEKEALIEFKSLFEKDPLSFILKMKKEEEALKNVISSLVNKTPIIGSKMLLDHGVAKGPLMKKYMDEAMRIYANHPELTAEKILRKLGL